MYKFSSFPSTNTIQTTHTIFGFLYALTCIDARLFVSSLVPVSFSGRYVEKIFKIFVHGDFRFSVPTTPPLYNKAATDVYNHHHICTGIYTKSLLNMEM